MFRRSSTPPSPRTGLPCPEEAHDEEAEHSLCITAHGSLGWPARSIRTVRPTAPVRAWLRDRASWRCAAEGSRTRLSHGVGPHSHKNTMDRASNLHDNAHDFTKHGSAPTDGPVVALWICAWAAAFPLALTLAAATINGPLPPVVSPVSPTVPPVVATAGGLAFPAAEDSSPISIGVPAALSHVIMHSPP